MQISTATIDCWLEVGSQSSAYFDFEHHHWDIGPSGPIDSGNNNLPTYTWTLSGFGHDGNGNWSTSPQSLTSAAKVRNDPANSVVSLTQTKSFGGNHLPAIGTNAHEVFELAWPSVMNGAAAELKWS